ncbi:MAG: recombination protein O N-terminal domain-containing protein [Candidatus Paceibacterota bacterium]
MHHIYTTEAILIKSVPIGEANRLYFLLTKDLGLIKATAQSVRSPKSKLNGHLQVFCLVKISVVKGKDIWRITSVESILQNGLIRHAGKLSVLHNISKLFLRLVHGEEKNEELFECIKSAYIICRDADLSHEELRLAEVLTVLRMMHFLGYIKKTEGLSAFSEKVNLTPEILENFSKNKKQAILEINNALKETHL